MSKILRLFPLWIISVLTCQAWGYTPTIGVSYVYDVNAYFYIDRNTESKTANTNYDGKRNFSETEEELHIRPTQAKHQTWASYFIDSFYATRGGGAFAGIREASQVLQSAGVPRAARVQILQSFEAGTVSVGQAGARQFGIRFFGGRADPAGRFLFDTFPASRQSLALRPEFNAMTGFRQFQIRPGATVISGRAASQGVGFEGGQIQRFILDPATDLLP